MITCFIATALLTATAPTTIERVVDGDTVTTSTGKVRLLWIDTPESHSNAHGKAMAEGREAAAILRHLLPVGATATLWWPGDKADAPRDHYGRILAVVIAADGTSAQEAQIRAGWSPVWRKYGNPSREWAGKLESAENEAKQSKAGAWGSAPKYMRDKANETTAPR